jgi:hypothetical protein
MYAKLARMPVPKSRDIIEKLCYNVSSFVTIIAGSGYKDGIYSARRRSLGANDSL